jgi:class 3 adenylate cyclase
MPEMSGYEAIKILKSKPETKDIPVIFLTAKTESDDELEGLSLGAIDYITKPFQPPLLLKRIEVHLLVEEQKKTLEKQTRELQYFNNSLRKAFSTYLSSDVVDELISDPTRLQLGGIQRRMTAVFTDVRHFTRIAETLPPEKLVELLNRYLSAMSNVILEQKGTIDKYEGDAIVAFFGAPLELPDHALRACISAITMKRLEAEFNQTIIAQKASPEPLFTRIGINSGDMVVGNMGTERKMDYTIMGNAVNLASRLEGINKQYGTWILASEDTVNELDGRILTRRLDRVRVVGKNESVRLYELVDLFDKAPEKQRKMLAVFHEALHNFEQRDWLRAAQGFKEALFMQSGDGPSKKFLSRCEAFLEEAPPDDWDGVYNLTEK